MHQAMLQQQQQPMYHPGLITAMSQMEPIPSGNLPPGFDATSCRSVYVGNIHTKVTDALLAEVFSSVGPLEGCKLIRKEKVSFLQNLFKGSCGTVLYFYFPCTSNGSKIVGCFVVAP
jgi:nucleolysin TIA-1/TIAR